MATSGSYKQKCEALAALLVQRTREVEGWKRLAESRFQDITRAGECIHKVETLVREAQCVQEASSRSLPSTVVAVTGTATLRRGVDSWEDFTDILGEHLREASATVSGIAAIMDAALATSQGTFTLPSLEEIDETSVLSLEEMGAVGRDASTGRQDPGGRTDEPSPLTDSPTTLTTDSPLTSLESTSPAPPFFAYSDPDDTRDWNSKHKDETTRPGAEEKRKKDKPRSKGKEDKKDGGRATRH